jgi:hypothetical protein
MPKQLTKSKRDILIISVVVIDCFFQNFSFEAAVALRSSLKGNREGARILLARRLLCL